MRKKIVIILALAVFISGVLLVVSTNKNSNPKNSLTNKVQSTSENNTAMRVHEDEAMKKNSGYITYADYLAKKDNYKNDKVVLFFHAPWCPTCTALDKDITANITNLPANTVIVKTDYDSSTELKKKYGVTYQHTLVQVDSAGNKIKKWSGSPELKDLVAEIQT